MNKTLFILLISLSIVLSNSCYGGCATCDGVRCLSCAQANAIVDPNERACVCESGYYASQLNPLVCDELISGPEEDYCDIQIGLNVVQFDVNALCYYYTEHAGVAGQELNYFRSDVTLDTTTHAIHFDDASCRSYISTKIQYQPAGYNYTPPESALNYIDLPAPLNSHQSSYVVPLPGGRQGDQRIQILLIDIYSLAYTQGISTDGSQITQTINFRLLISSTNNILYRAHRWVAYIYTNRNEVQLFTIEVDISQTQGCQPGQNCIVIADLDVTGLAYLSDFATVRAINTYTVGDHMYMRIWFKDATYTKQLQFQALYYLNDHNQVFDYTSIVVLSSLGWNLGDHSLHVELPLVDPSTSATIQVDMLIVTTPGRFRSLQAAPSANSSSQQFTLTVNPQPASTTATNTSSAASTTQASATSKTNSLMMIFGLFNLLGLILFF